MNEAYLYVFVGSSALTVIAVGAALMDRAAESEDVGALIARSRRFSLLGQWLSVSPSAALFLYLAAQIAAPAVFFFWRAPFAIVLFFGILAAFVAVPIWVPRRLRQRMLHLFDEQLPSFTDQLVASVRGSVPLMVSLQEVVPLLIEPMRSEIATLAEQANKGQGGIDAAITNARKRYDSRNYALILSVMHIFSRQGGNLIEPMQNMSSSFKEIYRLEKKLQTATQAARSAFWIINLGLLAIVLMISLLQPNLIDEIFDTRMGIVLFFAGIVVYGIGVLWLIFMTKVEI